MKFPLILVLLLPLIISCAKDEPNCFECSIMTITNESFICSDPEQIEILDPQDVQIICGESAKSDFMNPDNVVNISREISCDGSILISTTTRSPVCKKIS